MKTKVLLICLLVTATLGAVPSVLGARSPFTTDRLVVRGWTAERTLPAAPLAAGGSRIQHLWFANDGALPATFLLTAAVRRDATLGNHLVAVVTRLSDGATLYRGRPTELRNAVIGRLEPRTAEEIELRLSVPANAQNNLEQRRVQVSFSWTASG